MHVYTYWECSSCHSLIRGDNRKCPNCGAPIPNGVKYLMPNDPKVIAARKEYKIPTSANTYVDEKGVVSDIVDGSTERNDPNWFCEFCGYQNFSESNTCKGCGAPRSNKNYFSNAVKTKSNHKDEEPYEQYNHYTDRCFDEEKEEHHDAHEYANNDTEHTEPEQKHTFISTVKSLMPKIPIKCALISIAIMAFIGCMIWLFYPIERIATVYSFSWERSISVEKYQLCHESDWSVPDGGRVTAERAEIHHYNHVLDHYETRTRTVTEQVSDGYDTSYRDLGNGQAEVVRTPRYRTETRTETYQEPVYKDVPVYNTKYYYDIDKWKYDSSLETNGNNQSPYWYETDLPNNVENPKYGDLRQTTRSETYYVHVIDNKDKEYSLQYNFTDWNNLNKGDILKYKSFRFSNKPLTETVVEHRYR